MHVHVHRGTWWPYKVLIVVAGQCCACVMGVSKLLNCQLLRRGRANLRNASVTFSLFWHEASLG